MTVYDPDPLHTVRQFERAGATHLHLVDLEGAKTGRTTNLPVIQRIAAQTNLLIEVGGGIRTMDTVRRYLEAGASRVILGTAAVTDPAFTARQWPNMGRKSPWARPEGRQSGHQGLAGDQPGQLGDVFDRMQALGVRTVICTDISRDGR